MMPQVKESVGDSICTLVQMCRGAKSSKSSENHWLTQYTLMSGAKVFDFLFKHANLI